MGEVNFFCNICGGPPTSQNLIKQSVLPEDNRTTFNDSCSCGATRDNEGNQNDIAHLQFCNSWRGYDMQVLPLSDIKWLGDIRMVSTGVLSFEHIPGQESEDPELIYPIGTVDSPAGGFYYPRFPRRGSPIFIAHCNKDGFLVHDACWEILKTVYNVTCSGKRPLDPREFCFMMKLGLESRHRKTFDWGYGDDRVELFEDLKWIPQKGYEWIVADPTGPFEMALLLENTLKDSVLDSMPGLHISKSKLLDSTTTPDCFSRIPHDLKLQILEMLPSASVLNLLLASPSFRQNPATLPRGFWRSRISLDVPWCTDMVLSQMSSNQRDKVQYKQLLHTLKKASSVPGSDKDMADYLGLRNRRRIWRNCERIVHELETRFSVVRQKFGKAEIEMKGLTTRHVISISPTSNIQSEIISDVFFVPGPNKRGYLKEITAHFNSERRIIGIEFKLLNEASGRLFGNRSSSRETVVLDSSAVITAILVSFGPLESGQGHSTSIRGLGIIIQDCQSEPIYRLGTWTSQDVVQILRAGTEMQIVGVTGEYNTKNICTLGIIIANALFTPITRVDEPYFDLYTQTRWINQYFPLDWSAERYFLGPRYGDPSVDPDSFGADPPIFNAPVYFLNFAGRQLISIHAHYLRDAPEADCREFSGFTFMFADGTKETIGRETSKEETDMNVHMLAEQKESITGINLFFDSDCPIGKGNDYVGKHFPCPLYPVKLRGIEFLTDHDRILTLGNTEVKNWSHKRASQGIPQRGKMVCGFQIGMKSDVVMCMGLVFNRP